MLTRYTDRVGDSFFATILMKEKFVHRWDVCKHHVSDIEQVLQYNMVSMLFTSVLVILNIMYEALP